MSTAWRLADIERLQNKGMVAGTPYVFRETLVKPQIKIPREEAKPLTAMKQILKFMRVDFVTEYKFSDRKYRFDIYVEANGKKIGIEYDGIFSEKSRHTTLTGFTRDTEKTNLAAIDGFIVLRYTSLNYNQFLHDINILLT